MAFDLRDEEKILIIKRRHWFTLFLDFIWLIVLLSTLVYLFWLGSVSDQILELLDFWLWILLLIILFQILLIIIFYILSDYYLDLWVVTNQRSMRIELKGFFNRFVVSIDHNRVQDISVSVRGFFPTLFNYGDVRVQTAGAEADFIFFHIPDPYKTKAVIYKAGLTGGG